MAFTNILPLRVVQVVFAIIVLGLASYAQSSYTYEPPAEPGFLIFVAVWTILALIYLIIAPGRFPALAHKYAILGVEAITMIFWFGGFVAYAAFLDGYNECRSSSCKAEIAVTVFAAFEWALFLATTVFAALHVWMTHNTRRTHMSTSEVGTAPVV